MTARVRILHFTWRMSQTGGIPTVLRTLLPRLSATRFENHVCTVRPNSIDDAVHELGNHNLHPLGFEGRLGLFERARVASAFASLVVRVRPDVVHTHSGVAWYTIPSALRTSRGSTSMLLEVHDAPQSERITRLNGRLENFLLSRLGYRAVVHSTEVQRQLSRASGVPSTAIERIPLGIDLARFRVPPRSPQAWRLANGFAVDAPLVMYVARLVPSKNVALFLDVAERVLATDTRASFAVVGEGAERDRLLAHSAIRKWPDHVRLLGRLDDVVSPLHACDVFLSTSDYEGFGLAILEAMASGRAVVSTSVGGVVDLVADNETGALCSRDPAQLADAVIRLLRDAGRRERFGVAGRDRANREFGIDSLVTRFENLYERLVRKGVSAGSSVPVDSVGPPE